MYFFIVQIFHANGNFSILVYIKGYNFPITGKWI